MKLTMKNTPWAVDILAEGTSRLDKLGVRWWIEAGTLLGIYREGKLLDHDDPDLDITVQEPADHAAIKEAFEDYELFAEGTHQLVFRKRKVLFDINFYVLKDNKLIMDIYGAGQIVQEYSLFKELGEIKFNGRKYPTPSPIEAYLQERYHDWRTPKKKKQSFMRPGETKNFHHV